MLFFSLMGCFDPEARLPSHAAPAGDSGLEAVTEDTGVDTAADTGGAHTGDSGETGDSADTAPPEAVVIAIDRVEPSTVSTVGGETVTLQGGPYAADAVVTIGGAGGTVSAWTETTLAVVTPPGPAGAADVVVTTSAGAGSATAALTYVRPCTGVTPDPSTVYVDLQTVNDSIVTLSGCATGIYVTSEVKNWIEFASFPTSVDGTGSITLRFYGNSSTGGVWTGTVKLGTDQGEVSIDVIAN